MWYAIVVAGKEMYICVREPVGTLFPVPSFLAALWIKRNVFGLTNYRECEGF